MNEKGRIQPLGTSLSLLILHNTNAQSTDSEASRSFLPSLRSRPAYICHMRAKARYSPKKMWYLASMVRGLTVDEAIKQLKHVQGERNLKGANIVRSVELRDGT